MRCSPASSRPSTRYTGQCTACTSQCSTLRHCRTNLTRKSSRLRRRVPAIGRCSSPTAEEAEQINTIGAVRAWHGTAWYGGMWRRPLAPLRGGRRSSHRPLCWRGRLVGSVPLSGGHDLEAIASKHAMLRLLQHRPCRYSRFPFRARTVTRHHESHNLPLSEGSLGP